MRKPNRAAKANGIQAPASTALNAVDPQTASSGRSTTRRIKIFIAEARSAAPSNGFLGAARSVNFLRTILGRPSDAHLLRQLAAQILEFSATG
jgi:hypothetical protein